MNDRIKATYTTDGGRSVRMVYFHSKVQEFIFRAIIYGFSLWKISGRFIVLVRPESNVFPRVDLKLDIESDYVQVETRFFNPVVEIYKNKNFHLALKIEKIDIEEILMP